MDEKKIGSGRLFRVIDSPHDLVVRILDRVELIRDSTQPLYVQDQTWFRSDLHALCICADILGGRGVSKSDQVAFLLNFAFIRRMSRRVDVADVKQQYKLKVAFAKMDEMSIDRQTY